MTEQSRGFNFHVVLMIGILSAVIIAGFMIFPKTQEDRDALLARLGTTNHGSFIQPTLDLRDLPLRDVDGNIWRFSEQPVKWRYLIADDGRCQQSCRDMLYLTRQVHIRVGKNSKRLQRMYLLLGDKMSLETEQYIAREHPYLKVIKSTEADYSVWLGKANTGWQPGIMRTLVVDQDGRTLMYYGPQHDGNGILEDINHLLKYSPAP